MKRPGPLPQLTLALVLLTSSLLIMADLFLGVLAQPEKQRQQQRQRVAELLAVQVSTLMRRENDTVVREALGQLALRAGDVQSIAVRRADGRLLAEAGGHADRWHDTAAGPGRAAPAKFAQISVPLAADGVAWGRVELTFEPDPRARWQRWLDDPTVRLLGFVSVAGALAFGLYMRRALQHLDPASVIPDRIQRAFDALAEGVAVLDARGRVLLTNRAFRQLHPQAQDVRTGQPLSGLPWLGSGLPADANQHPWTRSMSARSATTGEPLEIGQDTGRPRQLVVNCAPITDAGGAVRGCMATFDDVTELHRANSALQLALRELQAAQDEVQAKNAELQNLATRDPLTGCLNRRALHEALLPLFERARADGTPLGCLVLDIDHFKRVNDTHGHGIGDRVIQQVARALQDGARATDLVCRYGGEEFCVIVPGLDEAGLLALAERLRARIEAECGPGVREVPGLSVTASLGVDTRGAVRASPQQMIDHADQALYAAKRGGRNRVARFQA